MLEHLLRPTRFGKPGADISDPIVFANDRCVKLLRVKLEMRKHGLALQSEAEGLSKTHKQAKALVIKHALHKYNDNLIQLASSSEQQKNVC